MSIQKSAIVILSILTLVLIEAMGSHKIPVEINDLEEMAYQAIIEEAKENPHAGYSAPDAYEYQWSDDIKNDISYLRTLASENGNVYCVQYYATDGCNVWLGSVLIDTQSREILGVSSEHVFTSGVTPFMNLLGTLGADSLNTKEYGELFVIKRTVDLMDAPPL